MDSSPNKRKADKMKQSRAKDQLLTPRATPEPGDPGTSRIQTRGISNHQNRDLHSEATSKSLAADARAAGHEPVQVGNIPSIQVNGSSNQAAGEDVTETPIVQPDESIDLNDSGGDVDMEGFDSVVGEIIANKHSEAGNLKMVEYTIDRTADLGHYFDFFDGINDEIQSAGEREAKDVQNYLIPRDAHHDAVQSLRQHIAPYTAKKPSSNEQESIQYRCNQIYQHIRQINTSNGLPQEWNIDIERIIQAAMNMSSSGAMPNNSAAEQDLDADDLDALESRARKDQHQFSSCEVISWWPKGTGTQTFVQYGDKSAPLYRIRAGSYEMYDKRSVERLWTTSSRGTEKKRVTTVDGHDEIWKWERCHVKKILAVGWKVPDDDDAEIDALSLIKPERGAKYPQTKCMILWTDNITTLEGRSFMRRIANGPAFRGDQMIYQKAKELEAAYEERNGPLQGGHDSQKEEDEAGDSSSDSDDMGTYPSDRNLSSYGSKQKGRSNNRKEKNHRRGSSNADDAIIKLERKLAKLKSNRRGSRSQRG